VRKKRTMFGRSKAGPAVTALACLVYGATSALAVGGAGPAPTRAEGFPAAAAQAYDGEGGYDIGRGAGETDVNEKVGCPRCGKAGDAASAECERCGYGYRLAAAGAAETVFFSGKSYGREGAPFGPRENRPVDFPEGRVWYKPGPLVKAGYVLVVVGSGATIVGLCMMLYDAARGLSDKDYDSDASFIVTSAGLVVSFTGSFLIWVDSSFEAERDYGFAARAAEVGGGYGRRPGGLTLKFGLSFNSM
jgi:hypothetical protein